LCCHYLEWRPIDESPQLSTFPPPNPFSLVLTHTDPTLQISKYLLTIIAPLLLLRSLVLAVYAIYFNALSHLQTLAADLVGVIFYGVPTVIIFATLVLIANQGDWFPEYQAVQQQPNNNAYPAYPNAYQGETAYQSQTVYVGQKPMEAQPWIPPPPPPGQPGPPGQQYYDTSYHR
jgi:hypothetical protein